MAGEYIEFNNNSQPALNDTNINRLQQLIKQDIQGAVSGDTLPVGVIMPFGSDTIPENWLLCNGQAVSRTEYQNLFNTIGTTFGQGDGFTTFNLPNLKGKVVVGKDENDEDFDMLGETGGEKEHTLTINEMPEHNHSFYANLVFAGSGSDGAGLKQGSDVRPSDTISKNGGGQPHNILQPYQVQNYIIKAKQSAGIVATVVDNLNSTSTTNALSANQGKIIKEKAIGTILYEDSTGTLGTVLLSDNAGNYDYIEIYYKTTTRSGSLKVSEFVNKRLLLNFFVVAPTSTTFLTKAVEISGNQITKSYECQTINNGSITDTDTIYIYKVVGYK